MELRFGAKLSLGLSQMPLQVIFMGGSFEYTKMIGCGFEGGGVKLWPRSDSVGERSFTSLFAAAAAHKLSTILFFFFLNPAVPGG